MVGSNATPTDPQGRSRRGMLRDVGALGIGIPALAGLLGACTEDSDRGSATGTNRPDPGQANSKLLQKIEHALPDGGKKAVGKGELLVNVKDFGALGDPAPDDSAAIQAAIDATPIGGTCFVPPRRYNLSSPLRINKPIRLLCGPGGISGNTDSGTVLLFDAGIDGIICDTAGAPSAGIEIGPFKLSGRALTRPTLTTGVGIRVKQGRIRIPNGVTVMHFGSHGIWLNGSKTTGGGNVDICYIASPRVEGCIGNGIYMNGSDSNGSTIIGASVVGNKKYGINIDGGARNQIYGAVADQRDGVGAYRDAGDSNSWHDLYSEGGAPFVIDAGSHYSYITFGRYAAPAVIDHRTAKQGNGDQLILDSTQLFMGSRDVTAKSLTVQGYTTAQLSDRSAAVNISGKEAGTQVWNSTKKMPMWAAGPAADDPWYTAAGAADIINAVTPA